MENESLDLSPSPDETLEPFMGGKLMIIQKRKGYRFSVDALLLTRFIQIRKHEKAIDLGTGCGILPLCLSHTTKARSFTGVEIQEDLAGCARRNVALNRLEDRITILHRDFRELQEIYPPAAFDVVFSNPPYRKHQTGRVNPSIEKAIARHEIKASLNELISISSYLLPHKGRCYLIFPASRTVDLLSALRKENLEPKRLQFVHPGWGEGANFSLVEAVKSSGIELRIMPPLILKDQGEVGPPALSSLSEMK